MTYTVRDDLGVEGTAFSSKQGIFIGTASSAPDDAEDGAVYYNSTEKKWYRRKDGAWVQEDQDISDADFDASSTRPVQNATVTAWKTKVDGEIDDRYTKSDTDSFLSQKQDVIPNLDQSILMNTNQVLSPDRVLLTTPAGKVATTSSVTKTEVEYLSGVKSSVQTQIDDAAKDTQDKIDEVNASVSALDEAKVAKTDYDAKMTALDTLIATKASTSDMTTELAKKQDKLKAGSDVTISADNTISVTDMRTTIDDALSASSVNPVQNKVVKKALDAKQDTLSAGENITISGSTISAGTADDVITTSKVDAAIDGNSEQPVQNKAVYNALQGKLGTSETAVSAAMLTTDAGTAKRPVYFSGGKPVVIDDLGAGAWKSVVSSIDGSDSLPTSKAVQTAIANGVTGLYSIKGSTDTVPESPTVGDVWNLSKDLSVSILGGEAVTVQAGANIVWTDNGWDKLSETVDLSGYVPKSDIPAGVQYQVAMLSGTAGKLVSSYTVGSSSKPIYLSGGVPTECGTVDKATSATKAEQDGNGDVISTTYLKAADAASDYLTKTDAASKYLTADDVSSEYLSGSKVAETYLSKTDAEATYATKASAIVSLSLDGSNGTYTKGDGTTGSFKTQDVYVKQKPSTDQGNRPVLLRNGTGTSEITSEAVFASAVTVNPSTGGLNATTVLATTFTGALNGNATSATKATQDGDGNVISTTYAKKTDIPETTKGVILTDCTFAFASDSTYSDFPYKGTYASTQVAAADVASVVFAMAQATDGNYAPVCETYDGGVYIWSKLSTDVVVPTIVVTKG